MEDRWKAPKLKGRVCLVTGASRGVGRGIARVLGQCGATVWVTGRSRGNSGTEGRDETYEETARLVSQAGGRGIAAACDHTDDRQVERLFKRIGKEGRLDLLVNNAWGGYEAYDERTFTLPFWEQPVERLDRFFRTGLRAAFTASRLAAPLMLARGRGLIINISAGDRGRYLGAAPYDTIKTGVDRLAFGMARDLRKKGVAALSLQPGFTRTERVVEAFQGSPPPSTHSPEYAGRAVAELLADPKALRWSGKALRAGDLGRVYRFTDTDGRRIRPFELPADL